MKVVVLAGGKGTRLAPYTTVFPKPLMPIGDMPILEILLRQFRRAGAGDVVLSVGHLSQLIEAYFRTGESLGLRIHYSREDKPLGTAGPLSLIGPVSETLLVTNGDILTTLDFGQFVDAHSRSGALATVAMHERRVRIDYGVIECDAENRITGYREKPSMEHRVSMGVYAFAPRVLELIPRNEYLDFPDLVLSMIAGGGDVRGYPFSGYWKDLGRPDDYEQAVQDFQAMRPEFLGE